MITTKTLKKSAVGAKPSNAAGPTDTLGSAPPLWSAIATLLCLAFAATGWIAGRGSFSVGMYVLSYATGGALAAAAAGAELWRRRLSVDLLMILAAAGAAILGDWGEGAVLLFLFSLSGTLEAYAMYRTTRSIDALIKLRPREASLVRGGEEIAGADRGIEHRRHDPGPARRAIPRRWRGDRG